MSTGGRAVVRASAAAMSLAVAACASPPMAPHSCVEDDERILFAWQAAAPRSSMPVMGELGADYLFVTADCRFFMRVADPDLDVGMWAPAFAGELAASELAELNENILERRWPDLVNENELVPPVVFDAAPVTVARGPYRHFCNDGCPSMVPWLRRFAARLAERSERLDGPIRLVGIRGIDVIEPPVAVTVGVDPAAVISELVVDVDPLDAAEFRRALAQSLVHPYFADQVGVPVLVDGIAARVWFREVQELEGPAGELPDAYVE